MNRGGGGEKVRDSEGGDGEEEVKSVFTYQESFYAQLIQVCRFKVMRTSTLRI